MSNYFLCTFFLHFATFRTSGGQSIWQYLFQFLPISSAAPSIHKTIHVIFQKALTF
nr:chemosensory protein [Semanotus bifasciatus]